jgi:hypothetical protein
MFSTKAEWGEVLLRNVSARDSTPTGGLFSTLVNQGDYFEVELFPIYVAHGGIKFPCARITLTLNGVTIYEWEPIVYHPRYGCRRAPPPPVEIRAMSTGSEYFWTTELVDFDFHLSTLYRCDGSLFSLSTKAMDEFLACSCLFSSSSNFQDETSQSSFSSRHIEKERVLLIDSDSMDLTFDEVLELVTSHAA